MRVVDSLSIILRLFWPQFLSYAGVMITALITLFILISVSGSYNTHVHQDFGNKQAHFTLTNLIDPSSSAELTRVRDLLATIDGVYVSSPFISVENWQQLSANTQIFASNQRGQFTRFNRGYVQVIGVDRRSPSIISWDHLNFYTAGVFKTRITNLEFMHQWLTNPYLIIPNAVLDSGFYPPISQEATVINSVTKQPWQVKGFIQDYADQAILYVGIDQFQWWSEQFESAESGVLVRLNEAADLASAKTTIQQALVPLEGRWKVTSWLEDKQKQMSLLTVINTVSIGLVSVIAFLSYLLVTLFLTKSVISKNRTINIFIITGYRIQHALFIWMVLISVSCFVVALVCNDSLVSPVLNDFVDFTLVNTGINSQLALFCFGLNLFSIFVFHRAIIKV